jgi:hypothetical protein
MTVNHACRNSERNVLLHAGKGGNLLMEYAYKGGLTAYKTVILRVISLGVKLGLSHQRKSTIILLEGVTLRDK